MERIVYTTGSDLVEYVRIEVDGIAYVVKFGGAEDGPQGEP